MNVRPEEIYSRFPQLQTDGLLLRQLRSSDADGVYRMFSDPQVTRFYDLDTFDDPRQAQELIEQFTQRFDRRIGLRWAIASAGEPDVLLGTCGYNIWIQPSRRAVLGFDLLRSHWRRGIMTEALTAVLDFGFETMELNRVEALTFVDNAASHGLLQKLGFRREGVLREYQLIGARFVDMDMHSLLRRER